MSFVANDINGLASIKSFCWSNVSCISSAILLDGTVHFYDERGCEKPFASVQKSCRASVISWSPKYSYLAIGWMDGSISLWDNGEISNSNVEEKSPINLLCWHPFLPILLSGSENGRVSCWDCQTNIRIAFFNQVEAVFSEAIWCPKDTLFAFLASTDGDVYSFDSSSAISRLFNCPKPIYTFLVSSSVNRLLIFCADNILSQYTLPPLINKHSQIKLTSGNPPIVCSIKSDVIAYIIGPSIHVTNLQNEELNILRSPNDDVFTSIHFNHIECSIYATTIEGKVIQFRSTMKGLTFKSGWDAPIIYDTGNRIESAVWSLNKLAFMGQSSGKKPLVFSFLPFNYILNRNYLIHQKDQGIISILGGSDQRIQGTIYSISNHEDNIMVITSNQAEILTIKSGSFSPGPRFRLDSTLAVIFEDKVISCKGPTLEVRNHQGSVKQTINLGSNYDSCHIIMNSHFICIISSDFSISVFDISRRQPKLQFSTQFSYTYDLYRIRALSLSSSGFCLAFIIDYFEDGNWHPCPDLILHSPQYDKTISVGFEGRIPKSCFWDKENSHLLCVHVTPYTSRFETSITGDLIVPVFVSDSLEVYRQSTLTVDFNASMVSFDVPKLLITEKGHVLDTLTLPQFEGMDNADDESRKALMELNYHLAMGDIESAFNDIRGIDNKETWRSLAQTCAQIKRIDLADMCFGRMEDAGSAMLLHKVKQENGSEKESLYLTCMQLGLYSEARNVAKENFRFDLLANNHESLREWPESISISNTNDRIHLKARSYRYARSMEMLGNIEEAIANYELSGTISNELSRLSLQFDDLKLILNYIAGHSSAEVPKKILKWAARFFEAHNQTEKAIEYYNLAKSQTDVIRLLCIEGKWDEASKIVNRSNQRSLICEYARLLMNRIQYYSHNDGSIDIAKWKKDVVELFRKARQFSQAMVFAIEQHMTEDILALSFSAPSSLVCKAAIWFESKKEHKNAVLMYSRSGRLNKALGLCFQLKLYEALDEISDSLTSKTDIDVLMKCGQHFIESERWSKAALCYVLARKYDVVLDLCNQHTIKIPKQTLQELSTEDADPLVLKQFASLCQQQNEFSIAAQLYVGLKENVAAMKCLIRSGDTSRVIKFAKRLRMRETYILAANYLQTMNPRYNDQFFELIEQFYNSANSLDKLVRFYESLSHLEIDEYQSYDNGLELITKAITVLRNCDSFKGKDAIANTLKLKYLIITQYNRAFELFKEGQYAESIRLSAEILKSEDIDLCIRSDDVYILMIRCYAKLGLYSKALVFLEDLNHNGLDLTMFMELSEIKQIYEKAGATYHNSAQNKKSDSDDIIVDGMIDIDE